MDAEHFETLLRSFSTSPSRRGALRLLAGSALGSLLGWRETGLGDAHDFSARCKKLKGDKKKKCVKKARKHTSEHASETPVSPGPTCSDQVKNGSESDVDCGGSCSRCQFGKTCTSRDDCVSAKCVNGTCQTCSFSDPTCDPGCFCQATVGVCVNSTAESEKTSCAQCPPGTFCQGINESRVGCHRHCGA